MYCSLQTFKKQIRSEMFFFLHSSYYIVIQGVNHCAVFVLRAEQLLANVASHK